MPNCTAPMSYEALEGVVGHVLQDTLVDLTGGAGEEIDYVRSGQAQIDLANGRLLSQLQVDEILQGIQEAAEASTERMQGLVLQLQA
ncbi:hypothetical protein GH714_027624 [Hevea brasiliensis]|uniref:Uncharacterized protein n=1 Tax=Hevea brasiliensis TaxID=3981 RepID=A0A6A6MMS4_HEVBR|nr:hypothetical protein GH714_027624 [Hevea brasiliensis]